MALAPADFYAYSRATGVPIPETPEERVELAPEVLNFRRNQLKAPQEESNPLAALGTAALGLGALAGLGFGARRLFGRQQEIPKGPARSANVGVRQVDLAEMAAKASPVRQVTEEFQPRPSRVPPQTVEQEFVSYRPDPKEMVSRPVAEARRQSATKSLLKAAEARQSTYQPDIPGTQATLMALRSKETAFDPGELGVFQPEPPSYPLAQAPRQFDLDLESLTDLQNLTLPSQATQALTAVESGQGQQIQKTNSYLQRNEDIDIVAAQSFLQQKREELSNFGLNRSQIERQLSNDSNIKEGVELFAATGDPGALSRLSNQPSSPLALKATQQEGAPGIPTPTVETSQFYKPLPFGENVGYLLEQDIDLTNSISSLSQQQEQLPAIRARLEEQANMAQFALKEGGPVADEALKVFANTQYQIENLPDYSADISEAINQRNYVRQRMESLEALGPKRTLQNVSEGFDLAEETGELIPRRRAAQSEEEKTKGGRTFAMYDPASQVKSSIGIYGIEPRNFPIADPELRPTALQREETRGTLRQSHLSPGGKMVTSTPEAKLKSLNVSEALRRGRIEGRDPQMILRQLGIVN